MRRNAAAGRHKVRAICLSALLTVGLVVSGVFATAAHAASYDAEGIDVTLDGVTYTCDFLSDGTAHLETPIADDGVTVINVPTAVENAGKGLYGHRALLWLEHQGRECRATQPP